MQEVDSARRIRQLRGLPVEELIDQPKSEQASQRSTRTYSEKDGKRRKLPGEDDTDRDIRYARQAQAQSQGHDERTVRSHKDARDVPLYDAKGHISLFPEEKRHNTHDKPKGNPEAELEKARRERELEDQYTMRFSNAAGFKQAVDRKPWYQDKSAADNTDQDDPGISVLEKGDSRRKQREQVRIVSDDPLSAIKRGVKGVRQAEKDRTAWQKRQREEIDHMIMQERYEAKRRHRDDDIEGFSLDANANDAERKRKHRGHRERGKRQQAQDRSRSPRRVGRHNQVSNKD